VVSSRSSFQRKLESRFFKAFWTPAFAGVTKLQTNSEVPKGFEEVLQAVAERYFPAFDHLHEFFLMKCLET